MVCMRHTGHVFSSLRGTQGSASALSPDRAVQGRGRARLCVAGPSSYTMARPQASPEAL